MKFFYYEFMKKACDEAIAQAENGLYYVEPAFRVILDSEGLTPENVGLRGFVEWDKRILRARSKEAEHDAGQDACCS